MCHSRSVVIGVTLFACVSRGRSGIEQRSLGGCPLSAHSSYMSAAGLAVPAVLQPDDPVAELGAGDQVEPSRTWGRRNPRRPRPWDGSTRRVLEDGPHVTRTTLRPCRHHRRGPRYGDGVGLGLEVEGRMFVEGEFLDTVIGIPDSRTEIVMLRPPDGGTGLELSSFVRPDHEPGSPAAMANELGLRNVAFRSTTSKPLSTSWPRTATGWSAASGSTSRSGAWPTCADRRGSSCPWPSASADAAVDREHPDIRRRAARAVPTVTRTRSGQDHPERRFRSPLRSSRRNAASAARRPKTNPKTRPPM
jgi:hypothetical protein